MLSCEWCGRLVDERLLNGDGYCPSCADPDLTEFERDYDAHLETYKPIPERSYAYAEPAEDSGYNQTCPRCGQGTDRLVGVTHRNGATRYVCEDCQRAARTSDASFWHWFHKE